MFTEEAADELLSGKPDFVLDAIDNIDTKVGAGRQVAVTDTGVGPRHVLPLSPR